MGNAPRCPKCGSSNTRKSDDRLLKGGLSFLGDIALGYGLGKLGLGDFAQENAEDITLSQFVDDEFQCRDCGCVWKPGQRPVIKHNQQHQGPSQSPKKKNKPQSTNQQLIGGTSTVPYSRRQLVDIIAQCEGLNPGSCNESSLLTTDKNVIIQQLQNKYGIQLSKSRINNVNTYKGLINKILEVGSLYQTVETVAPTYQENEDDFGTDWDLFFDNIDSYLGNRQSLENEYNNSCRKARKQVNRNPNASACYYYKASVLCYFFYDDSEKPENDREYALELGKSAINSAKQMLQDDGEFKTLSLVYEMLDLTQKEHDVYNGFQKIQTIKNTCPRIETLSNTLIKTEALKEWFDKAYYDFLFEMMLNEGECLEKDVDLKAKYAMELTNSPEEYLRLFGHAFLSDALYDGGKYNEAKRYAKFGMDILGVLTDYDHDDQTNRLWGMCFTIYARSQEKVGELKDAIKLYEQGAALGIPWCKQDLERFRSDSIGRAPSEHVVDGVSADVMDVVNKYQWYFHELTRKYDYCFFLLEKESYSDVVENVKSLLDTFPLGKEEKPLYLCGFFYDENDENSDSSWFLITNSSIYCDSYEELVFDWNEVANITIENNILCINFDRDGVSYRWELLPKLVTGNPNAPLEQWRSILQSFVEVNKSDNPKSIGCQIGLTDSEQEYLDTLKESFEDGDITPRERKMLERIRISLGISEERAKEIESLLFGNPITEDEREYVEMYKEYLEDGEISEKERRRLNKFAMALGISQDRINELEKLSK